MSKSANGNSGDSVPEILQRLKEGDPTAREELFSLLADQKRSGAAIRAMARRVLPPRHRARRVIESQDIVQSALRTGWGCISDFRGETEGELFAWFRTILATKVSRATRRRDLRVDPASVEHLLREPLDLKQPSLLSALIGEELRERLWEGIQALPDDQSVVVTLRLEGLTTAEIGQILGLKEAAVRKRESRAVNKLKALVK